MKRSATILALFFTIASAFAQDLTSKKGEPILPEAKDWSIGIDATPFLNYLGNFFGKSAANQAPTFNFLTNAQTITGKYFKDAKTAYRAGLRIGINSFTAKNMVPDRAIAAGTTPIFPVAVAMKENSWRRSITSVGLSAGIEKRRGKTRLQGIYGAEAGIYVSSSKDKFTYGNALSTSSTTPVNVESADAMSSTVFGAGNNVDTAAAGIIQGVNGFARITERKNGTTVSFGVRAFVGAEYFILPKMSIGGEFGWGLGISTLGRTITTYESRGTSGSGTVVAPTTIESARGGSFRLDTDNMNSVWGASAALKLNLYF